MVYCRCNNKCYSSSAPSHLVHVIERIEQLKEAAVSLLHLLRRDCYRCYTQDAKINAGTETVLPGQALDVQRAMPRR